MTREEIKEKASLCFLLNPNNSEEEKNCVIDKVMATRATIVSKAALGNIIIYLMKQNAKLKKQLENRNCSNCCRSKTECPNDGSCKNLSLWEPYEKPQLTKAKKIIKNLLSAYTSYADSFDDRDNEIVEQAGQFLEENE